MNVERLPSSPDEFSSYCRTYLRLGQKAPFNNEHMQRLVEDFGLAPAAFYNPGGHWTLITDYDYPTRRLGLYDPMSGLRLIEYGSAQKVWYFLGNRRIKFSATDLSLDRYRIEREPLDQMGAIQTNPVDCGPLSIFALKLVRGIYH